MLLLSCMLIFCFVSFVFLPQLGYPRSEWSNKRRRIILLLRVVQPQRSNARYKYARRVLQEQIFSIIALSLYSKQQFFFLSIFCSVYRVEPPVD